MLILISIAAVVITIILSFPLFHRYYLYDRFLFSILTLGVGLAVGLYSVAAVFALKDYVPSLLNFWLLALLGLSFLILLLYPLWELVHFSRTGQQAEERYHRLMERFQDYIGSFIKNRYIIGLVGFAMFYLSMMMVLLVLGIPLAWVIIAGLMIVPIVILGYYAAVGSYRALVDQRSNTALKWSFRIIGVVSIFGASHSIVSFITGFSIIDLFKFLFLNIKIEPRPASLLSISLASVFIVVLTLKGFLTDFWKGKQTKTLFHCLFAGYFLVIISMTVLLKLVVEMTEVRIYLEALIPFITFDVRTVVLLELVLLVKQVMMLVLLAGIYLFKTVRIEILSQDLERTDVNVAYTAYRKLQEMGKFGARAIIRTLGLKSLGVYNTESNTLFLYKVFDDYEKDRQLMADVMDVIARVSQKIDMIPEMIQGRNTLYINCGWSIISIALAGRNLPILTIISGEVAKYYSELRDQRISETGYYDHNIPDDQRLEIDSSLGNSKIYPTALKFLDHIDLDQTIADFNNQREIELTASEDENQCLYPKPREPRDYSWLKYIGLSMEDGRKVWEFFLASETYLTSHYSELEETFQGKIADIFSNIRKITEETRKIGIGDIQRIHFSEEGEYTPPERKKDDDEITILGGMPYFPDEVHPLKEKFISLTRVLGKLFPPPRERFPGERDEKELPLEKKFISVTRVPGMFIETVYDKYNMFIELKLQEFAFKFCLAFQEELDDWQGDSSPFTESAIPDYLLQSVLGVHQQKRWHGPDKLGHYYDDDGEYTRYSDSRYTLITVDIESAADKRRLAIIESKKANHGTEMLKYAQLGRWKVARKHYEKAKELKPDYEALESFWQTLVETRAKNDQ